MQCRRETTMTHLGAVAALLVLLGACRQPESTPPAGAEEPAAAAPATPDTDVHAPEVQPALDVEPALSSMRLAKATSSKLGVPVDLRYSFVGDPQAGLPVTLHLAAVPRVAGRNLNVTIKQVQGIQAKAAAIVAQKADLGGAYRQQLAVTRQAGGPEELRVLVTMEMPEGSAFGYFSVPLTGPANR